jgi:hypothetical protein
MHRAYPNDAHCFGAALLSYAPHSTHVALLQLTTTNIEHSGRFMGLSRQDFEWVYGATKS